MMYDRKLGIKVVIKSLRDNTQCAEFTRPDSYDNSHTSQEVVRERFIEVTIGARFSIAVAFKKEFDWQTARRVNITRQIDDKPQVSAFEEDKQHVGLKEVSWDNDLSYIFEHTPRNCKSRFDQETEKIPIEIVDDLFEDKLVAGTGFISVSVRLGNNDGLRFIPIQPAIRFIFRYGSKGIFIHLCVLI